MCYVSIPPVFTSYYMYIVSIARMNQSEVVGSTKIITLRPDIKQLIADTFHLNIETATVFYRAVVRGEVFYSREYSRSTSRNSYTVEFHDSNSENNNSMFGYIEYFLGLPLLTVAVVTFLQPNNHFCYPSSFKVLRNCIVPVSSECGSCVICLSSLHHKCVCINLNNNTYVARLPNHIKSD